MVRGFRGGPGGSTNTDLATTMGITTDQLNSADQTATSAALKQAVEQGLITQAQADAILKNGLSMGFGGFKGMGGPHGLGGSGRDHGFGPLGGPG